MLRDYLPLQPLGSGATGIVFLARPLIDGSQLHLDNNDDDSAQHLVAVKAFRRSRSQDLHRSHNEEIILSRLLHQESESKRHNPFLPRLHRSFEDGEFRFLVLDYCAGGDLDSLRQSLPEKRFSATAIRFYAAEVVLALEHLHALGIVYRDLKPENILLSSNGHLMLSDFDLSVMLPPKKLTPMFPLLSSSSSVFSRRDEEGLEITKRDYDTHATLKCLGGCLGYDRKRLGAVHSLAHGCHRIVPASSGSLDDMVTANDNSSGDDAISVEARSHSFVGTEEYVAPEVIEGIGHDFAVDWWALGVLLFEMAYAVTPFRGRTTKETFHNIVHRQLDRFPGNGGAGNGAPLADLISQLLVKDPSCRLGSYAGAMEVKAHPFLAGVRWDELANVLRPPFIPETATPSLAKARGFDLTSHLVQVECSRAEAKAMRKLQRKQAS